MAYGRVKVRRAVLVAVHSVAVADRALAADALTTPWERAVRAQFDPVIAAGPIAVSTLRGALPQPGISATPT